MGQHWSRECPQLMRSAKHAYTPSIRRLNNRPTLCASLLRNSTVSPETLIRNLLISGLVGVLLRIVSCSATEVFDLYLHSLWLCIFEIRMFFGEKWERMRLGFRAKLLDQPDGNFDPSPDHWSASKTTEGNWFSSFSTRWHGWETQDFWKWVLVNIFPTKISSCEYFEVGSQVFQSLWEPEKANLWEI